MKATEPLPPGTCPARECTCPPGHPAPACICVCHERDALALDPSGPGPYAHLSERDRRMAGYSDETKRAIVRLIEASPVLEEAILDLAELAFMDGESSW